MRESGRGGGDRKDKLLNKAWALYALQLPLPSNWNKRNRRQAEPALRAPLDSNNSVRYF